MWKPFRRFCRWCADVFALRVSLRGPGWEPANWTSASAAFERDLYVLLSSWIDRLEAEAQRRAPGERLPDSIRGVVRQALGQMIGSVATDYVSAAFVEFGTGIYSRRPGASRTRIRPKRPGGVLRWVDEESGEVIYAKSIAGARAQPFILDLLNLHRAAIVADVVVLAGRHGFR